MATESSGLRFNIAADIGDLMVESSALRFNAVYNIPAETVEAPQFLLQTVLGSSADVEATQLRLVVVGRGRVENPDVRAWTYTLDGHDFYVLRLGDEETLVYDLTTEQWSRFTSSNYPFWRANTGMNWRDGISLAENWGSNVIVGDDSLGVLWFLDPNQNFDDSVDNSNTTPQPFPRVATGQLISRSRQYIPIFEVFLTGSNGWPSLAGSSVDLKYSDDAGNNYVSAGPITPEDGNYNQEYSWLSLGRFSYPGRLFRIEDNGALARIDGLDINHGTATS